MAVPQLRFPIGVLRIAGPKGKHRVGQSTAIDDARVDADDDSAVMTTFNFPGRKVLQGRYRTEAGRGGR